MIWLKDRIKVRAPFLKTGIITRESIGTFFDDNVSSYTNYFPRTNYIPIISTLHRYMNKYIYINLRFDY